MRSVSRRKLSRFGIRRYMLLGGESSVVFAILELPLAVMADVVTSCDDMQQ